MKIAANNVELAEQFAANRERLDDAAWLEATLSTHCYLKYLGWPRTRLRIIQHPREFAAWLVMLARLKVRSYVEVGTSTGGSFFTTDSYLRASVPDYQRSVGYDRTSKLRDWDIYKARFPQTEFRHQSSEQMDVSGEKFDAAFVDARHAERWVLQDLEKVLKASPKVVGFHDILRPGVDDAWAKIKSTYGQTEEFKVEDITEVARCGIGAVVLWNGHY